MINQEHGKPTGQEDRSFIALGIALLGVIWSIYAYNQSLPLSQSQVVFSDEDVDVLLDLGERRDIIKPKLRNIGKSPARNVRLSFYSTFLDDRILFSKREEIIRFWGKEKVIHDLQSGASTGFGSASVPHEYLSTNKEGKSEPINLARQNKQLVLIFELKYEDGLNKAVKENLFFFQYVLGSPGFGVYSLVNTDYKKIYPKLMRYFEKTYEGEEVESPYILDFLKRNPPF